MDTWTIERVKAELPDVRVAMPDGKIVDAMIGGRLEKYPTVSPHGNWPSPGPNYPGSIVSWSTIVHCLNADIPIRF